MIYPVKIFDKHGNLKAFITEGELHARHWKNTKQGHNLFTVGKGRPVIKQATRSVQCYVCNVEFQTTHKKSKYCGKICAHRAEEMKKKRTPLKNEKKDTS